MVTYIATLFVSGEVKQCAWWKQEAFLYGPGKLVLNVVETQQKNVRWLDDAVLNRQ
jgi:hypothetical protein